MARTGYSLKFALALAFLLTGCNEDDGNIPAAEATSGDEVAVAVPGEEGAPRIWSFAPPIAEEADALANRLPSDPGRMILVPSTNLFPGMARIDPEVENPLSGDPDAIAAGERHFTAFNCAGCHAPLGGGGMGPPLSDDRWIYGSEPAQMFLTIMHGRPEGMPAFGSMLPAQTVWELVAYVETLSEIDDYAAENGFDENVDGFRDTTGQQQPETGEAGGGGQSEQ